MRRAAALALAGVLLALAGCSSTSSGAPVARAGADDHGYHGTWLSDPYRASDVALRDTAGHRVRLDAADSPVRLVFFGYTNCPDVCQVVTSTMASALTRLTAGQRDRVQAVFVTTDPARDTPKVLRTYLDRFDPAFVGLTGSLREVVAVAKDFHIFVAKGQRLPSGGYEVDHGTYVIGVRGGHGRVVWNDSTSAADMAADVQRLLKEKA